MAIPPTIRRIISIQPIGLQIFHPIALKLIYLLSDNDYTVEQVVDTASEDQVLAGQLLQMANSTNYVGRVRIETMKDALIRLGAHQVSNLAMAASQAAMHVSSHNFINEVMQELWLHSHACALGCRWVALNTGHAHLADQAYLAGLIHDVGKLHLLKSLERLFNVGMAQAALERNLLLEIFNELHVVQGSRVMQHWFMPPVYRTALDKHHDEEVDPDEVVLAIVRLVNMATRNCALSLNTSPIEPVLETPEATLLDFTDSLLAQLEDVIKKSADVSFELKDGARHTDQKPTTLVHDRDVP